MEYKLCYIGYGKTKISDGLGSRSTGWRPRFGLCGSSFRVVYTEGRAYSAVPLTQYPQRLPRSLPWPLWKCTRTGGRSASQWVFFKPIFYPSGGHTDLEELQFRFHRFVFFLRGSSTLCPACPGHIKDDGVVYTAVLGWLWLVLN